VAPAVVRHRSSRVRGRPRVDRQASDAQGIDLSPLATHEFAFDDAAAADEIFSILMGEDVESRRGFIQRNAKDVRFLDI